MALYASLRSAAVEQPVKCYNMGKNNLLLGTARGKLGDVVFYRTGGEQRFRTRVRPTNPRTNAQLLQRCVMSTIVKAYSNFISVCDHAFQNYSGKQKNMERYMRLNAVEFREIALGQIMSWSPLRFSYPTGGNWCSKDDTETYVNYYIISEGDLPTINIEFNDRVVGTRVLPYIRYEGKTLSDYTYQEFVDLLGLNAGDQLTFVMQFANPRTGAVLSTHIARIILMPANGDMSEKMFSSTGGPTYEILNPNPENYGKVSISASKTSDSNGEKGFIGFSPDITGVEWNNYAAAGVIVSRFENNMWRRSNCQMVVREGFDDLTHLEEAMASYLKSDTSSLYLNQATTGARTAEKAKREQENAEAEAIELQEDSEENANKRRKK